MRQPICRLSHEIISKPCAEAVKSLPYNAPNVLSMSTLIICLPPLLPGALPGAAAAYDYAVTPDGRTATVHASAPAALLPTVLRGGETVAVVPVAMLSWHRVEIPKGVGMASPRVRVILESLLEDRLLDDADQLHLALAPGAVAGTAAWVAACDKRWLRTHLQALEAAGRPVGRIVPEFSPDAGPLQLHILGDEGEPQIVATGGPVEGVQTLPFSASAIGLLPLPSATLVASGLLDGDPAEADVSIFAEPLHAAQAERLLQRKVGLLTSTQRWLDAARSPWDLAQFELLSSSRTRTVKRLSGVGRDLWQSSAWKPARWGALLLLVANLGGLNVWALKEQSALQRQRAAVQGVLTQTFPQIKLVVDAPVQMERQVAALRQATGASSGRDLEAMLGALAAALPPDRSADGIEFAAGEARFKGLKLQGADTSALVAQLKAQGYIARIESDVLALRPAGSPVP